MTRAILPLLLSLPLAGAAQPTPPTAPPKEPPAAPPPAPTPDCPRDRSNEATTCRYLEHQAVDLAAGRRALEMLDRRGELDGVRALVDQTIARNPGLDGITPGTRARLREGGVERIAQALLAHGFTYQRIVGLRVRGFDPVKAMEEAGPSPSLLQPAILAEQVVVAEWLDSDVRANIGDGQRSTVRFRVRETLKGDARVGQVYRVRFASGETAEGYAGVSTESQLLPAPSGSRDAFQRGRRYILLLSQALHAHSAAMAGGKSPVSTEPYVLPLTELIAVEGETTGGNHGYPGGERLDAVRRTLAPLALADRQVREIMSAGPENGHGAAYALGYPIDLAEGRRRMQLQETLDRAMLNRLRRAETATYAGHWIQHEPDYRVVVAFTRAPEATLRRYTTDPLYEARLARRTATELNALQDSAFAQLRRLGVSADGGTDIKTGRLQIRVLNDWALVQAARADGRLKLPDDAQLIAPPPLKLPEPGPAPAGAPYLARLKAYGGPEMQALNGGRLVVEDGCVRLDTHGDGPTTLVVFTGSYALDAASPGAPRILDLGGGRAFRIGDEVSMAGGEGGAPDAARLHAPIPARCKGPYWYGSSLQLRAEFEAEMLARDARHLAGVERIPYAEALRRMRARRAAGLPLHTPPPPPPPPPPRRR